MPPNAVAFGDSTILRCAAKPSNQQFCSRRGPGDLLPKVTCLPIWVFHSFTSDCPTSAPQRYGRVFPSAGSWRLNGGHAIERTFSCFLETVFVAFPLISEVISLSLSIVTPYSAPCRTPQTKMRSQTAFDNQLVCVWQIDGDWTRFIFQPIFLSQCIRVKRLLTRFSALFENQCLLSSEHRWTD